MMRQNWPGWRNSDRCPDLFDIPFGVFSGFERGYPGRAVSRDPAELPDIIFVDQIAAQIVFHISRPSVSFSV